MGVEVPDYELVEKILRTIPMEDNPKVSTLEYQENLEDLNMVELYGILTAYELRLGIDNIPKGEAYFKVIKKKKAIRKNLRLTIMKNLMKKKPILSKNFRKDQGSIEARCPSNVLSMAELGTFKPSVLIPRKTLKMNMTTKKQYKKEGKFHYKKNYKGKRNLYSKEEDNSSSEVSDIDDEVLFLGIEESNEIKEINHKKESEDEAEVNMEKELFSVLNGLTDTKTNIDS